jgi:hypothetical protein
MSQNSYKSDNFHIILNKRNIRVQKELTFKFPLALIGALAPGSVHARLSAQAPIVPRVFRKKL